MRFAQEISIFNPFAIEKAVISLGTSITQTARQIELQATEIAVVNGKVETNTANISIMAGEISSKVESSTFNSTVTQLSNSISTKVSSGDVVSEINQSSDKITLSANRISITSTYFKLTETGVMTASDGTIGPSTTAANRWKIGGNSSRAWIYSGNKSSLTATQSGVYIGTDGVEIRAYQPGIENNYTRITGGRLYSTWITIYDSGGSRYASMVISDDSYGVKSGYYRIGFTNGIVTGAEGEDRSSNVFRNESVFYNQAFFMRRVEFEAGYPVHFYGPVYFHDYYGPGD